MPSYVVYCHARDGVTEDGVVSVWDDIDDAQTAAMEYLAMDPENSYEVQVVLMEIVDQPQIPFYDYSNCTEVPF
jgi:hypothetical protein